MDRCSTGDRSCAVHVGGRQVEVEDRAAGGGATIAHLAAHRIDDAVADGESESGALPDWLGGEERLKKLRFVILLNAGPGVFNFQHHALTLIARSNGDASGQSA